MSHPDSVKCLLTRLQHLNDEHALFETKGFNFFGLTNEKPPPPPKPPPPKVFIETTTQDQIEDIESTKQKITEKLKEINDMQKKAFDAQKEKMKICYDFFSKYEGSRQATDWARSFWFGLHYVQPPKQYDPRKRSVIKPVNPPQDWVEKMRFGRPYIEYIGMDPNGEEEVRKNLRGYKVKKEKWEAYVDAQWETAFDNAFGVSEFQAFLATIPAKINVDLETTPPEKVETTWFDLYEETRYFKNKISMDHVQLGGREYDQIVDTLYDKRKEIGKWNEKPDIVRQLYLLVQDLVDEAEILNTLKTNGWMPTIITYEGGGEAKGYIRDDPITRTRLERTEPPVKMKRKKI
jgi:hypothetical protein